MEENKLSDIDLQAFRPYESFRHRLERKYEGKIVIVEFCCGKFMKKALGCLNEVGADFLELIGTRGHKITIDIYGEEGIIDTENQAFKLAIPIDRVCGVELLSCPPPCPPHSESEEK